MTQLISEQKIEEAAMKFDDSISWEGKQVRNGFNAGVDFALKEIEPLMIEFAKFVITNGFRYDLGEDEPKDMGFFKEFPFQGITDLQLLEKFIKKRNIKLP